MFRQSPIVVRFIMQFNEERFRQQECASRSKHTMHFRHCSLQPPNITQDLTTENDIDAMIGQRNRVN